MATWRSLRKLSSPRSVWEKSNPHSEDAGAPKAACPRAGGEECEHSAGGLYCCASDGGGVGTVFYCLSRTDLNSSRLLPEP
jgi:hypothetical protein